MSTRRVRLAALAVAAAILAAGAVYAATRPTEYESSATLLLAPAERTDPEIVSSLLESFQRSGTSGTFVELISSEDTLRAAEAEDVEVTVRAVPDSRTIGVTARDSDEEVVEPALERVIEAAQERQDELGDVWELQVLGSPGDPEVTGVATGTLLGATALLALLGAALATVVFGRYRLVPVGAHDPATLASGPGAEPARGIERAAAPAGLPKPAEPAVHLDLESFRFVRASPTTVLVQVVGYWRAEAERDLSAPTLLLHDGQRMHPIAPLAGEDGTSPSAGPETPLWRGSYAAPVEIFDRSERHALRAGPGVVIGLPAPIEQGLLSTPDSELEPDPADAR